MTAKAPASSIKSKRRASIFPKAKTILLAVSPDDDDDDEAGAEPPSEFRIFAYGDTATAKGSYSLDAESASAVMAAYADQGNRLTLDYEHMAISNPPQPAPAAGSFALELRADGIYAVDVKWTAKAAEMLRNKEYLYFSPAFKADKSGRPSCLLNVALTNLPATKNMESLVAANLIQQESRMNAVLHALSLKEDADESEALSAVVALTNDRKNLFDLSGAVTLGEAVATITAWKQSAADVTALREQIAKQEAASLELQFDAALEAATSKGIVPPSAEHPKRKFALSMRGQKDGVASLNAYVAALGPAVVTPSSAPAPSEPAAGQDAVVALTSREKEIAEKMGIPIASVIKNKARLIALSKLPSVDIADEDDDKDAA